MRDRFEIEFLPDDDLTAEELARRQSDKAARDAAATSNAISERHWPEGVDPLTMPLKDQNSNQ